MPGLGGRERGSSNNEAPLLELASALALLTTTQIELICLLFATTTTLQTGFHFIIIIAIIITLSQQPNQAV